MTEHIADVYLSNPGRKNSHIRVDEGGSGDEDKQQ